MQNRMDWKFILPLVIAIVSVVVPILLWKIDLSSKALMLTVKSIADLQPQGVAALDGVQVFADSKPLNNPFVSVLELKNTGTKPILVSDFESPLKILSGATSVIAKAQISSSNPLSLEPIITLSEGAIFIQPLLLNPSDAFRLTVITANGKPEYVVRGRIAGVTETEVNNVQAARESLLNEQVKGVVMLLLVIYTINMMELMHNYFRRRIFMPWLLITGLATFFGATFLMIPNIKNLSQLSSVLPMLIVSILIGTILSYIKLTKRSAS